MWCIASCWSPSHPTVNKVHSLVRNYKWSGDEGERKCRAKVAWDSLILPHKLGGIKLLDPETQIHALMAKLLVRSLLPGFVPWKTLMQHRLHSERGENVGLLIYNSCSLPIRCMEQAQRFGGRPGRRGKKFEQDSSSSNLQPQRQLPDNASSGMANYSHPKATCSETLSTPS